MTDNPYELAERVLYPLLKEDAKRMRKNPTQAEDILWGMLRKKQLGVKFNRQYIIECYIVDFVCHGVPSPLVWEKYKDIIIYLVYTYLIAIESKIEKCNNKIYKYILI